MSKPNLKQVANSLRAILNELGYDNTPPAPMIRFHAQMGLQELGEPEEKEPEKEEKPTGRFRSSIAFNG